MPAWEPTLYRSGFPAAVTLRRNGAVNADTLTEYFPSAPVVPVVDTPFRSLTVMVALVKGAPTAAVPLSDAPLEAGSPPPQNQDKQTEDSRLTPRAPPAIPGQVDTSALFPPLVIGFA